MKQLLAVFCIIVAINGINCAIDIYEKQHTQWWEDIAIRLDSILEAGELSIKAAQYLRMAWDKVNSGHGLMFAKVETFLKDSNIAIRPTRILCKVINGDLIGAIELAIPFVTDTILQAYFPWLMKPLHIFWEGVKLLTRFAPNYHPQHQFNNRLNDVILTVS